MINLTTIEVINKFLGKTLNPLKQNKQTHTHIHTLYKLIINNKGKASKSKEVKN